MVKAKNANGGAKTYAKFEADKSYALFTYINDCKVKDYRVRVNARGKVTFGDEREHEVVNFDIKNGDIRYHADVYATVIRNFEGEKIVFTVNNTKYEAFAWKKSK